MTTSVQRDRLEHRFHGWDVNGDGQVDRTDWQAEAERVLQGFGRPSASPLGGALIDAYLGMWRFFADKAGVDEQTGSLTLDQFNGIADEHVLQTNGSEFERVVRPAIQVLVELVNPDGHSKVGLAAFKTWLDGIRVSDVDPTEQFRGLDADGDGQLSVRELVEAVRAYYLGRFDVQLLGR